ncbi:MAG: hypothetical protein V2I33_26525 [Kangiellaceae bacterium]|nr:hypothetical protein [Kangiellaceae bacterium]
MCDGCNCVGCSNNPDGAVERDEAMNAILDRNPHAFKPKISDDTANPSKKHRFGCN